MRPGSQKTYYFAANVPSDVRQAVAYAFLQWTNSNSFTGLNVSFSENQGTGDFLIQMVPQSGLPNPNAAAAGSWSFNDPPYLSGGVIRFTTNTALLDNVTGYYKAALHEIGHAHGLGDREASDRKSVMNQFSGKNDVFNALPMAPSSCDATQALVASENPAAVGAYPGGGSCPGGGCVGYQPFPSPCGGYNENDGWCYPGFTPESFPSNGQHATTQIPPGIVILSPGHGSTVGSTVDIRVASGDPDGRVMRVTYYANGQPVHTTYRHPFNWMVYGAPAGTYTLQAVARDNRGLEAASAPVTFIVTGGSGGGPPGGGGGGSDSVLSPGEALNGGQRVYSGNGSFYLEHQSDGNLVFHGPGGPTWASMTFGGGGYTRMQSDGNLVSYNGSGVAIWASMTFSSGSYLNVQDDGNLVIYTSSHVPICLVNALQPGQQCP